MSVRQPFEFVAKRAVEPAPSVIRCVDRFLTTISVIVHHTRSIQQGKHLQQTLLTSARPTSAAHTNQSRYRRLSRIGLVRPHLRTTNGTSTESFSNSFCVFSPSSNHDIRTTLHRNVPLPISFQESFTDSTCILTINQIAIHPHSPLQMQIFVKTLTG